MPLEAFVIQHRSGKVILAESFGASALDRTKFQIFVSSVSTLSSFIRSSETDWSRQKDRRPQNDDEDFTQVHEREGSKQQNKMDTDSIKSIVQFGISFSNKRYALLDRQIFLFVALGSSQDDDLMLQRVLFDIEAIMFFHLGPFTNIANDISIIEGIVDIFQFRLGEYATSLSPLVDGISIVPVDAQGRGALDVVTSELEGNEGIRGSIVLLGRSVIHQRRVSIQMVQQIAIHVGARPMTSVAMRVLPIFEDEESMSLVMVQINGITLTLLCTLNTPIEGLISHVEDFEVNLEEEGNHLPSEEPSQLMKYFGGHDILALVYHNFTNHVRVVPAVRASSPADEQRSFSAMHELMSRAARFTDHRMHGHSITISLTTDEFRFVFTKQPNHELYVLLNQNVDNTAVEYHIEEILTNISHVLLLES